MATLNQKTIFPPVRACLFDMDGLLINTEDIYTQCTNIMLHRYNRPPLPWSVKARLQGRPGLAASEILHAWAQLPISLSEYNAEVAEIQRKLFPAAIPLPGVKKLLADLREAGVYMALATSSNETNFQLKTTHLENLFSCFDARRRILGDDTRIPKGRGKPAPDIYLLALQAINDTLAPGEKIRPDECLVFEDSVPGVEAGRRAGMRVIWCPHPELWSEFEGRVAEVLAGRADKEGELEGRGEIGDGWAEYLETLVEFPYERYGIKIRP